MSEKRLLQAAGLLVRSLRTSKKPEMLEIGAVSDLRSYLISQETVSSLKWYNPFHGSLTDSPLVLKRHLD